MISPANSTTNHRRAAFERELDAARSARRRSDLRLRVRLDDRRRQQLSEAVNRWVEGR